MRTSIIAAAFAVASLSFAASPSFAEGWKDLGIDISQAGSTHASVVAFVNKLSAPGAKVAVEDGCATILKYPDAAKDTSVTFCTLLKG
jgi:hypothetical protein